MAMCALLRNNPQPTVEEIDEALQGKKPTTYICQASQAGARQSNLLRFLLQYLYGIQGADSATAGERASGESGKPVF